MSLVGYQLTYNGVPLDILRPSVERTHIYSEDGTTYLYTRWVFDGDFAYNPQAVCFNAFALPDTKLLPVVSDNNIRDILRQSRQRLTFSVGGTILLQTPRNSNAVDGNNNPIPEQTDAKNGPLVERCNIRHIMGVKTMMVDFRVVAHVNECAPGTSTVRRSPLLSHRWTQTETIDDDYYSVVVTEGTCVFRSDELMSLGPFPANDPAVSTTLPWPRFPDQFRADLFHPIPNYFKRSPIQVTPHSDGVTYSYRFTDTQKPTRGPSDQHCTRMEAYVTGFWSQESFFDNVTAPLEPHYKHHVLVRAWGDMFTTRIALQNNCMAVIGGTIGFGDKIGVSTEFFCSHDVVGHFVQMEMTINSGLVQGGTGVDVSIPFATFPFTNIDASKETISSTLRDGNLRAPVIGLHDTTFNSPIPPPSGDGKSRGSYRGNIVSQALQLALCGPPSATPTITPPGIPGSGLNLQLNPNADTVQARPLYY